MINPSAIPSCPRRRRRGFTLIELLVAVSILVVMLLAFGQIISQSQILVNGCQQIMRMNTTASVTAQLLQRDLLSLSKDGSLTVGTGKLTFTQVSPHSSVKVPTVTANAALIDYGRKDYSATNGILYRQALLLMGPSGPTGGADDALTSNLGPGLTAPAPVLPADINAPMGANATKYWAFLARGCTKFDSSCYTNGAWAAAGSFSSANLTNWPSAVKVVFALQDGAEKQEYELLIDLP